MIGSTTIRKLDDRLEYNLAKELRDQGHYLTGRLERSIDPKFIEAANSVALEVFAEDYINQVNTGLSPDQVDISDPDYIRGMLQYIKLRFNISNEKQALRLFFKIAAKHEKEGIPTRNSYQFSSTGERTHAIENSYDDHQDEYDSIIDNSLNDELEDLIDKSFTQTIF